MDRFLLIPKGRHYVKDDFLVATSFIEPMGLAGDTALDLCMTPVPTLLHIAEQTGKPEYKNAAKKALEFCMPMTRPEGGDYWETPLHAPNLLAAGHAAIAYYLGYKAFGDERYKEKAIYWIRSVIPFTHLWDTSTVKMVYNTKPCLCSSDWYFANWVRDHVQWEVLTVFINSANYGIFWEEIDPAVDWNRYFTGITVAAIRWMHTHEDNDWRPHNHSRNLGIVQERRLRLLLCGYPQQHHGELWRNVHHAGSDCGEYLYPDGQGKISDKNIRKVIPDIIRRLSDFPS